MPVRVKCRCGQELVLRYGEWVYFFLGLVLLCLVINSVALLLLYFRLEEISSGTARLTASSALGEAEEEPVPGTPEPAAEAPAAPVVEAPRVGSSIPGNPPTPPKGGSAQPALPAGEAPEPIRKDTPPAGEAREGLETSVGGGPGGLPETPAVPAGRSLASIDPEAEAWATAPWRERTAPRAGKDAKSAPAPWLRDESIARLYVLDRLRDDALVVHGFLLDPDEKLRGRAMGHILAHTIPPVDSSLREAAGTLARASSASIGGHPGSRKILDAYGPATEPAGSPEEERRLEAALDSLRAKLDPSSRDPGLEVLRRMLEASRSRGMDLAILIDVTRSMESTLHALQRESLWLFPALGWSFPNLQVGIVLYRDDVEAWKGFSPPEDRELLRILRGARAEGGGDVPEGVHHAVRAALSLGRLSWRKSSEKHVIVIGDSPPPYRESQALITLVKQAREQGGYHFHAIGPRPEEGLPAPGFFVELSKQGGGGAIALGDLDAIGGELFRRLLPAGGGPALDPLPASLRALFSPGEG